MLETGTIHLSGNQKPLFFQMSDYEKMLWTAYYEVMGYLKVADKAFSELPPFSVCHY